MESTLQGSYAWPEQGLSAPRIAGYFELTDRNYSVEYCIPYLAVHLYSYHGRMRLAGQEASLQPGDLTITPPLTGSRYHLPRPGTHLCLHLPVPDAPGPRLQLPWHVRLGDRANMARERLVRIIDHGRRAGGVQGGPARAAAAAGVLELLAWLADLPAPAESTHRGDQAVERAAAELRLRPERAWRMAELAARVGLSPAYLARRFRRRFGHTVARYQLVQRIGAAQALLACTAEPVGAVGARVGLPDPHHFNKLFRRIAGVPPSVFRSRHRAGAPPVLGY